MPSYVTIANTQVDPGKPATSALAYAFRDNLLAVITGGASAPGVQVENALSAPAANVGQFCRVSVTVHPTDTPRKKIDFVAGGGTAYQAQLTQVPPANGVNYDATITLPTTGTKQVSALASHVEAGPMGLTAKLTGILDAANKILQLQIEIWEADGVGGPSYWSYSINVTTTTVLFTSANPFPSGANWVVSVISSGTTFGIRMFNNAGSGGVGTLKVATQAMAF